jgi:hypothetical protein
MNHSQDKCIDEKNRSRNGKAIKGCQCDECISLREKHKIYSANWRVNNIEKVREQSKLGARKYRNSNPEKARKSDRNSKIKKKYGITPDDYDQMLEDQGGVCTNLNCKSSPPEGGYLDVDHDHACCPGSKSCGKCVRGLLCKPCNLAAGLLRDSVEVTQGLAEYFKRSS